MRDRGDENGDDNIATNRATGDDQVIELDAADHALVATLRALPPEGEEPDWKKLEAAIRAEVSPLPMPAPWWRNWRWLIPIGALATTAAIVMTIQLRRDGDSDGSKTTNAITMRDASVPNELAAEKRASDEAAGREPAAAMWLDGEAADLDDVPAEAIDTLEALDPLDGLWPSDPRSTDDDFDDAVLGVLPASDYQWIDTLRDDEAARLETYLARKRS